MNGWGSAPAVKFIYFQVDQDIGTPTSALQQLFFLEADWFPLLRCWGTNTYRT